MTHEDTVSQLVSAYLKDKGLTAPTQQQLSKANSYASCYIWYLSHMKVTESNAAIASDVWVNKYALCDASGNCLEHTPEDTWDREATALANEEIRTNPTNKDFDHWHGVFLSALTDWKYSPQGSGMYALGNPYVKASVSNCFVAPSPQDSLESIFDTARYMARTYASRGGVGINLNALRPFGAFTNNAAKTSTGAASFMDFFSYVTGMIGQSGRRGALMQCMTVHHPDIVRFIEMKTDKPLQPFIEELKDAGIDLNDWKYAPISERLKSTSFANISVMITDEFMAAVKGKTPYTQRFNFKGEAAAKYKPMAIEADAEGIWETLMHSSWKSAEPGILFWDHISRESTSDYYVSMPSFTFFDQMLGEEATVTNLNLMVSATNPCGEQPLPEDDSCCLGTHALPAFVKFPFTEKAVFDFKEFERVLRIAVRAQDNIKGIDAASLPIQSQRAMALLLRRIGLGNTGLSDCMASLGIRYDTEEAIKFVQDFYAFQRDVYYDESVNLAQEKGVFPAFDWSKHTLSPFICRLPAKLQSRIKAHGIRNIALLTQAPNGSMSILFRNSSSGSEPTFMLASTRNMKISGSTESAQYTVYHQAVQDALDAGWSKEKIASIFIEAGEIDPRMRVRMQGAMQLFIDSAISITTNLKSTATVEEVRALYEMAHEYGCKGFTVYRDGCRAGVLNAIKSDKPAISKGPIERPKTTDIAIHKVKYKDKPWCVLVGSTENGPIEAFAGIEEDTPLPNKYHKAELTKRSRGHYSLTVWLSDEEDSDIIKINNIGARFPSPEGLVITRFISLSLRNRVPIADICEQLQKSSTSMFDYPAVLNRVLKNYIPEEEAITKEMAKGEKCPQCGSVLGIKRESGCIVKVCDQCNYVDSKCG